METIQTINEKRETMKFNLTIEVDIDEKKFFTNPDNGKDFYTHSSDDDDLTLNEIVKSTVACDLIARVTSTLRNGGVLRDATVSFKSRGVKHAWRIETNHYSTDEEMKDYYGVDIS